MERGIRSPLTSEGEVDQNPVWTPDGTHVVFGRGASVMRKRADGTGDAEELLTVPGAMLIPESWGQDGRQLLFTQLGGPTNRERGVVTDVRMLSLEGEPTVDQLIQSGATSGAPSVSPNGQWVAYHSDVSGAMEIYIERFPEPGDRQLISTNGGRVPFWSPDGNELFYRSVEGSQMLAVQMSFEPTLSAGVAEVLFDGPYVPSVGGGRPYHLTPDGERFLIVKAGQTDNTAPARTQIILVQNWFEELTRLVPTN